VSLVYIVNHQNEAQSANHHVGILVRTVFLSLEGLDSRSRSPGGLLPSQHRYVHGTDEKLRSL
jgi:hypothetical protein